MIVLILGIIAVVLCLYGMYRNFDQRDSLAGFLLCLAVVMCFATFYFCTEWRITCDVSQSETGVVIQPKIYRRLPIGFVTIEDWRILKRSDEISRFLLTNDSYLSDEELEPLRAGIAEADVLRARYIDRLVDEAKKKAKQKAAELLES